MGKVNTSNLVPGMILSSDVYNYNDQLILPEGLVLTEKAITKLNFYSIPSVRIKDVEPEAPKAAQASTMTSSYAQRLKQSPEFLEYQKKFEEKLAAVTVHINDIVEKNKEPDVRALVDDVMELLHPDRGNIGIFDMIHNMRQYDDITFAHSLNVGLICYIFAEWLHMSKEDMTLALTCGLLHDVGKLRIPASIIKKPGKLTKEEFDIVKTHPIEGYKILHQFPLNEHIINSALMHHERSDGSGYPLGITSDKIDKFAKIVAIADTYEATTAPRNYRKEFCPFEVIAIFEDQGIQKYDTKMIMTFLENIINTYIQNRVRLNNGEEGDIIFINKQCLSRPTIRCGNEYIDLMKRPDLKIVAII